MPNIVILTGAGISAESGLKTFRDSNGLWEGSRVEDVATPEAFLENPQLVHRFYNARRQQLLTVEPNAAHHALARLEMSEGFDVTVITQNVDDLHERAGQKTILHMHGELRRKKCTHCGTTSDCHEDLSTDSVCESCAAPGGLRPDIVWFGEIPSFMTEIENAIDAADMFIAIGTSGHVYPAAGLVEIARYNGAITVELNKETTLVSNNFNITRTGSATKLIPSFIDELLSEGLF